MLWNTIHSLAFQCIRSRSTVAASAISLSHKIEFKDAKPFEYIPRIPALPYLGTIWAYLPIIGKYDFRKFHVTAKLKQAQYGDIVKEDLIKGNKMVHLFNPDDIETAFRNEGKFPERRVLKSLERVFKEEKEFFDKPGIFNSNGEDWWRIRTRVQPHMLKPRTAINYLPSIDSVAKEFVDRMAFLRDPKTLEIENFYEEINRYALEAVGIVALDARLGCLSRDIPLDSDAKKILDSAGKMFDYLMQLEFNPGLFGHRLYKEFKQIFHEFTMVCQKYLRAAILRAEKMNKDEKDMTILEQFLATKMDPKDVAMMINDIFLAGIDTTSNSTGFFLYYMCRNPEIQEKVHQEIRRLLPKEDSPITSDVLNNARYLKACVRESMRLSPVVSVLTRTLPEDLVLSGYKVPKGTQVILNSGFVGLSEKYYENPDKFVPERWLRSSDNIRPAHHPFSAIPFGFGARACIGRRIAEFELYSGLIRIIGKYRLEYHYKDIDMYARLVNTPDKPLKFQFYDR